LNGLTIPISSARWNSPRESRTTDTGRAIISTINGTGNNSVFNTAHGLWRRTLVFGLLLSTLAFSTFASAQTVRDDFEDRSYSNNDGTADWVGDWIEDDVDGPGPTDGNVQIRNNGRLRLRERPDTGTEPSLAREANLLGATIATLNFDWDLRRVETDDSVVIEISSNGGPDWTVLEDFTGLTGTKSGSRSFDITAFAAVDTQIRFRVNNGYDGQEKDSGCRSSRSSTRSSLAALTWRSHKLMRQTR